MLKKKKLMVNLIFVGASALFTILVICLIIFAKGGCAGPKKTTRRRGEIKAKVVQAVGLKVSKKKEPEAEAPAPDPNAEADAAAAAKKKAANAKALAEAVEDNKEILDKPVTDKTTVGELDEMIRIMKPLVRDYDDQSETKLYQNLKAKYDLVRGEKALR